MHSSLGIVTTKRSRLLVFFVEVVRFRPPIIKVHSRNPFLHCTSVMSICLQLHKVAQENSHKLHLLVVPFLLYSAVWKERNEENNFNQKSDSELIKEQKRIEVETEIRSQVDELMRQELKNLKLVNFLQTICIT